MCSGCLGQSCLNSANINISEHVAADDLQEIDAPSFRNSDNGNDNLLIQDCITNESHERIFHTSSVEEISKK